MEVIDQIRQAANIVELASQYTTLRRAGRRHVGLCPFHSEKTPSFTLDEEKQLFHCFGCGTGGDVFTLIMEKENLSFPEAVRYLAEKYNISLPEHRKFTAQNKQLGEELKSITEEALAHFRKNLHNTNEGKDALSYLKKRKISDETIQKLKIGYALNSWDALISYFKKKDISPRKLENAGLAIYHQKKDSFYDRFRGRIIFPIFTEYGKVVAFGGRSLFNADPKYLNSPDTRIYSKGKLLYGLNFCKEEISEKEKVILVEGYTDFASLFQAGIKNLAASLGTSLTPEQIDQARRFARKEIILCFDGDKAGLKAASRGAALGIQKEIQTRVIRIPSGLDPDSFIEKKGVDSFMDLIKSSLSDLDFLIEYFSQGINIDLLGGKSKVAMNIADVLKDISNPIRQSDYIRHTSENLNINENELRSMIKRGISKSEEIEKVTFLLAEKILLEILFKDKGVTSRIASFLKEDYFKGLKGEPIFREIKKAYTNNKKVPDFHELKEILDKSTYSALSEIQFGEYIPYTFEEAKDCIESLKERSLEMKCAELDAQIKKLQRNGNYEKTNELLSQKFEIKKQLSLSMQRNQ
jgi:DNA primase